MTNRVSNSMSKTRATTAKEAGDGGDKAPGRKQPVRKNTVKKSGASHHDDDESVDSRGNINNLIAYSSEDESDGETDDSALTPEQKSEIKRSARKAALKARERILQQTYLKKEARHAAKKKLAKKVESDSEEEAPRRKKPAKKVESETEEEEEDDEEEDDEDVEDEDEEDMEDEDEEEYEEDENGPHGIHINIGGFADNSFADRMKPKRHVMKKENEIVNKFFKLVTNPVEENTIDDQLDQFKSLSDEKQAALVKALERKPPSDASQNLMFKILTMKLPEDTQSLVLAKYNSLQTLDTSSGEYFKLRAWLEKLTSLPLGIYRDIPVKVDDGNEACTAFMNRATKCLGDAIYGQEEAKLQVLQFIASKISNPTARGMSLLLAGPPGIGKTSLIKNGIAKALNWPFQFISLGGDSDASTYTGHQLVYESSHCGKIVNSLIAAKSMSMVLMFDELDKISATPKGEEVQNLLIHLTDTVQNGDFEDKYLSGVPLDLSKVMFAFSGNDLGKIDRVLLDRMVVINLEGYSSKEKLAIAENFIVPAALKEVNLDEKVSISKEVIQFIIENYAKEESGVRELKRSIEQITQKINMLRIFNTKELPFHIPNFHLPFVVKKEHAEMFLKKKVVNDSISHLYT
jgi:ATP-dependent Lon protease